jgi:phosphoglycerate dehydrogenase-like enzyme
LRLIQMLGAGVDQLLPSPDLPSTVEIAGVRGVFAPDVAEHAVALMLSHARRLPQLADDQRARKFEPTPRPSLAGQHVAILGYGEVGRRIARATLALDMKVRVVSRSGRASDAPEGVEVVTCDEISDAVGAARYVFVAVPLTPATTKLVNANLLARMRGDAYLVNIARGGIVDEIALADALATGKIAGAALDVFADEPLPPEHPLWSVPRLTITPHIAGLGECYVERCVDMLLENVSALEEGTPRRGLVDRDVGY